MLHKIRGKGIKTAIHSNGTPGLLEAAVQSCCMKQLFDDVISIEEVGVYKPHPRAYQMVVDHLGLPADRICFISSNGWDVHGAAVFGFRVVWVNRNQRPPDILPGEFDYEIPMLSELPGLL